MFLRIAYTLIILSSLFCSTIQAQAGSKSSFGVRTLNQTNSFGLKILVNDYLRNKVYYADSAGERIGIIDVNTEEISWIKIGTQIQDISITKTNNLLAIAAGSDGVRLVNLKKSNMPVRTFNLPKEVKGKTITSVAFNHYNRLIVSTTEITNNIHIISLKGELLKTISDNIIGGSLVKTSNAGNTLAIATRRVSPTNVILYDITDAKNPKLIAKTKHGSVGGNLQDFTFSPDSKSIYLACGSPYVIQKLEVNEGTLELVEKFSVGAYPASVSVSTDNRYLFATISNPHGSYYIQIFNLLIPGSKPRKINLNEIKNLENETSVARGLIISPDNTKVFAITGDAYKFKDNYTIIQVADTDYILRASNLLEQVCEIALSSRDRLTNLASFNACMSYGE